MKYRATISTPNGIRYESYQAIVETAMARAADLLSDDESLMYTASEATIAATEDAIIQTGIFGVYRVISQRWRQ